ncbi:hypothetical protein AQ490_13830 [Wenjunlia vitaminophila]|uniref:Pvc16 N-terminal domain-containing protein n=1 Tax=Wenjunlia vitaminophila TaxID=76728 RepID=A0A0T6LW05_WENVI|nr:DUF4255 domain-containing protein [Wenjunlia vitaminophila]KRV50201.1 hypothetical protein AQ490_13830 [Wenjunlia vitaminophila]
MIHEVDEGLRRLFAECGVAGNGVELAFDAPTKEWVARRNAPTVSVFLHQIREEVDRRQTGTGPEHDADGVVSAHRSPPRWFELAYLVTAWTSRPQDEHRLLSEALRCLVDAEALPPRLLTGTLARLGLSVGLDATGRRQGGPSMSDVWSALGGELKPSIDLRVTAPLTGAGAPAGPPVSEGMVVRVTDRSPGAGAAGAVPGRRLRYDGATGTEPTGLGAARERPLPPGRRRRRGAQP